MAKYKEDKIDYKDISLGEEEIFFNNKFYASIKQYSKDNFIVINNKTNKIKIVGNLVSSIFKNCKSDVELSYDEFTTKIYPRDRDTIKAIKAAFIGNKYNVIEGSFRVYNLYGTLTWLSIKMKAFFNDNNEIESYYGYIHDITLEKLMEEKLEIISEYDELTRLPSVYNVKDTINEYLNYLHSNTFHRGALLLINIDNFKMINDSFSHKEGDILLEEVSKKLISILDENDLLCRYSGDEYIVFKPEISSIECLRNFAETTKGIFKTPFKIRNNDIFITISIGIAVFPEHGNDFNTLLKHADTAMDIAKSNGKDIYELFDEKLGQELTRSYSIQKGLRTALDNNELYVVFQPKVILDDFTVNGFEALLRWNSSELGEVGPVEFIPIAEKTRLIIPMGRFVLEEVFKKVKYLLDNGFENFKIAVNFSEVQFRYGNIVSDFQELIEKYQVSPKYIEVEITESILMTTLDENVSKLEMLKDLGTTVALDDFGTGYSSLNYLTKLPIDVLKIDRSFVVDLMYNKKSRCIVENIINLSHELGIDVVAEGVEDLEQVEYLKEVLCDIVQGYYYSKPKKFEYVHELLGKKL